MAAATAYGSLSHKLSEDDLNGVDHYDHDETELNEHEQQVLEHINTIPSQPPQLPLNMQFESLSLDGRPRKQSSASIGTIGSAVLNLVRSKIPASESTYDMVESEGSDDDGEGIVRVEKSPGGYNSVNGRKSGNTTSMSSPILVGKPESATAGSVKAGSPSTSGDRTASERRVVGGQTDGAATPPPRPPSHGNLEQRSQSPYATASRMKYSSSLAGPDSRKTYESPQQERRGGPKQPDGQGYHFTPYSQQAFAQSQGQLHVRYDGDNDRPSSSHSQLFEDFDGIHFNPELSQPARNARQSEELHMGEIDFPRAAMPQQFQPVAHQPSHSQSPASRRPDSGLVYYPAPVPALLNLPPTLSKKKPAASRDSAAAHRKSMALSSEGDRRKSLANLPPTLRASVLFDSAAGAGAIEIPVKEDSAVATLDSILDASAKAPPVAFTEHPLTGGSGKEFVPPAHVRNRSTATTLNKRQSVMTLNQAQTSGPPVLPELQHKRQSGSDFTRDSQISLTLAPPQPPQPRTGTESNSDSASQPPSHSSPSLGGHGRNSIPLHHRQSQVFFEASSPSPPISSSEPEALPITLLAELEARQAHQRSRNRTAASAFPSGMHSTLLDLDTVAQVQKEIRRMKRTHLAWEAPEDIEKDKDEDEDVPLGLIYGPNANKKDNDEDIPLGIFVRKQMEDNEPLSKRRERLKSDKVKDGGEKRDKDNRRSTMYLNVPGLPSPSDSGTREATPPPDSPAAAEDEPLAVRMKKLKEKKAEALFGTGSLGIKLDEPNKDEKKEGQQLKEETLGQRRRRLQMEREQKQRAEQLKRDSLVLQVEARKRRSMLDMKQQFHQAQLGKLEGGVQGLGGNNAHGRSQSNLGFYNSPSGGGSTGGGFLGVYPGQSLLASRSSTFLGNGGGMMMGMGVNMNSNNFPYQQGLGTVNNTSMGNLSTSMGMRMRGGNMGVGNGSRMNIGMVGGMSSTGMAVSGGLMAPVAQNSLQDQRQREMVERWRSSIL